MDKDSLIWMLRLIIAGVFLNLFYFGSGNTNVSLNLFGAILILGGLCFIIDFKINRKFQYLYWPILLNCALIIITSLLSYIDLADPYKQMLENINSVLGIWILLSFISFNYAMSELCFVFQLNESLKKWKLTAKISMYCVSIPVVLFVGLYIFHYFGLMRQIDLSSNANKNIIGLMALLIFCILFIVPIVSFFISSRQMLKELKNVAA